MHDNFPQLVEYIRHNLGMGVSEARVREHLREHNWSEDMVNAAFQQIAPQSAVPAGSDADPYRDLPATYGVLHAIGDAFRAIRANLAAYAASQLIAYVTAIGVVLGLAALTALAIVTIFVGMADTGTALSQAIAVGIGIFALYVLAIMALEALIVATSALAIADGMHGRKSPVGPLLSRSFGSVWRVLASLLVVALIAMWPLLVTAGLQVLSFLAAESAPFLSIIGILFGIAAVIWLFVALIRYTLVPFVALFEPQLRLKEVLARSHALMRQGGVWFVVKLMLLMLIPASVASSLSDSDNAGVSLFGSVLSILLAVTANGAITMLYFNRRAVKGTRV